MHPVAYFSRKLCPAKQNYDMGNQELPAIKLTLKEWRHWLAFYVITDHKIPEIPFKYLKTAKRLNRFYFSVSYRPGAESDESIDTPETILPHHIT